MKKQSIMREPMKNSLVIKINHIGKGVKKAACRMALGCFLIFASFGSIVAQNDNHYVIKRIDGTTVHYLSHADGSIQDALTFDPETCIWYSSNNYNYYFMSGGTRKYLKAPLSLNGTISVADNPGTQALNNNTYDYFFYDWDQGLARGVQHFGGTCPDEYNIGNNTNQCWEAVWVSYEDNQWKMSSVYGYEPTTYSARFLRETETEYPETISNESGGVGNLADFSMNFQDSHPLDGEANAYSYTFTPAYTYYYINGLVDSEHGTNIPEESYYYYDGGWQISAPTSTPFQNVEPSSYAWSIECEDGVHYLSFAQGSDEQNSILATPTLYYRVENTTGSHKLATLTLTVTYASGATQTRTATVTVKTRCQNPIVLIDDMEITYVGVTVSWLPSADEYKVFWKKQSETTWNNVTVGNVTSYTITGLEYNSEYSFKVQATCDNTDPTAYPFTTLAEPGLMVSGAIFGGGRMADVTGNTEVVAINFDQINTIYGGNDIAGAVHGTNGSTITMGVNQGDDYASIYGYTPSNVTLKFGDVYGGGNGYYAYDGASFVPATEEYTAQTVEVGASVNEMTPLHQVGDVVWTNNGTDPMTLEFPSIMKTKITVSGNYVKADSIFGGAKNAFLTTIDDYYDYDGSLITIKGGTIMAVFGGNNYGGDQGYGRHHIVVNGTTTNLVDSIYNSATTGYGRDFGIRYLFGGGNKVYGSTTKVEIFGGQCDTIFAGGNSADVYAANVTVDCSIAANSGTDYIYGNVYSNAINTYAGGTITPKDDYDWNGFGGIYNVRTLFGGNNMATFDSELNGRVPTINLLSGSIGTVYGGGNAGDMWGLSNDDGNGGSLVIDDDVVKYGTHVIMNSPTMLVDLLYGGCQVSNVRYGTWVEIMDGHVGTVYGGCNVSGDVGSTREDPDANSHIAPDVPNEDYQKVFGGTYVVVSGGIIYKNLFGGGNGYYHCLNDNGIYEGDINYTEHNYLGLHSPTHNETHAIINSGLVKGNVYAGGNLACVGFENSTVGEGNSYPVFVGLSSVNIKGGTINGSVYGGCNMANVHGSCAALASGGIINTALYGGNDRMGSMARISNRVFPDEYKTASDNITSLENPRVCTYVGLTGNPTIPVVFGGSNGYYKYFTSFEEAAAYQGPMQTVVSCNTSNLPIQKNIFVDVGIDGGDENGAHIGTVYGGGDGVTVTGFITVFENVKTNPIGYSNVGTIFGGNNKGDLLLVPDIIMLNGQVNTIYGGCNEGAMTAGSDDNAPTRTIVATNGDSYDDIGSYVHLRASYDGDGAGGQPAVTPNIMVMDAIYGGCRMNGVTKNSLVLVEGRDFSNTAKGIFGGSDISGYVAGKSFVATTGGIVGNVYGGGNGDYYYECDPTTDECSVYTDNSMQELIATGISGAPNCYDSGAEIMGGQVGVDGTIEGNVFGGGLGKDTNTTHNVLVNVGPATASAWTGLPVIYGNVYGGSALGNVNSNANNSTTVNFYNGTLKKTTIEDVEYGGNIYGGGLGRKDDPSTTEEDESIEAKEFGKVFVNIGTEDQTEEDCFIDLRQANVFGCNNTNGSPKDEVTVHVWRTAFDFPDDEIDYSVDGEHPNYAIDQVFGGGNLADYVPSNSSKKILVYVHNCLNTIRRVFSGGNAAAAEGVSAIIDGGRMDYVFGGGNGEVTAANIGSGGTNLVVKGGTINSLFGGSNTSGDIAGPIYTEVNNDSGCAQEIAEFYGGSNQAPLSNTEYGVYSIIKCGVGTITEAYGGSKLADIVGDVTFDVRGGNIPNVFGGSKGREGTTADDAADITGNVTLNLEGGEITNAFGGTNINGNITGTITVNVVDFGGDCGLDLTNVYGAGNQTPYTPTDPNTVGPVVNVMHIGHEEGIKGNVFGGAKGDADHPATVTSNPVVNFGYVEAMSGYLPSDLPESLHPDDFVALVSGSVYGGGELAPVSGSTEINVNNGTVIHKVVGGGKQANITANTKVYIKGGTIGTDGDEVTGLGKGVYGGCDQSGNVGGNALVEITGGTIGVSTTNTANVHGGGYGQQTNVAGNVTVNFGKIVIGEDGKEIYNPNLILYGELYGGSALGNVNTADMSSPGATTITKVNLLNGTIVGYAYGGGLGEKTDNTDIPAYVYGRVYLKVGTEDPNDPNTYRGQANLVNCNVYGCNNLSGSPQSDVFVDVYQTRHIVKDSANYIGSDRAYAIDQLFGGGNKSDYNIEGKKANVYIHGCQNTIRRTFGGGNAAEVYGVRMNVDGGRFLVIFGGGNGEVTPANIGYGGIDISIGGGNIGTLVNGSNMSGTNSGGINSTTYEACGSLEVTDYFLGSFQADIFADINAVISCTDANLWRYENLYCGSNLAQIYGNINVVIGGGTFNNVFGGSKGRLESATEPAFASNIYNVTQAIIDTYPDHPELKLGHGGNVGLTINGGTIGNLFGGCDQNGNIDGKISIVVEENDDVCPLFIGNIYGAGNMTDYTPTVNAFLPTNPNALPTPNICILRAKVGGHNNVIGDYEGNVFGGGNYGNVTASSKVIVGKGIANSPVVDILGNVYGGGNQGDINGSANVVIMPETHALSYTAGGSTPGAVIVYDGSGNTMPASGNVVGEGIDLRIKAIPSVYGYSFNGWTVTNGSIAFPNDVSTLFTMGTGDATLAASFVQVATRPFSFTTPEHGSITVTDGFGANVPNPSNISIGAELNIKADPASGYRFLNWNVSGDGYVTNPGTAISTFTMGEDENGAILSATFEAIPSHTLTFTQPDHGTISVAYPNEGPAVNSGDQILEGTVLNILATPATGYRFVKWTLEGSGTISNRNNASTTLTIGIGDAILIAEFEAE